jgi:hypothetical protein
VPPRGRLDFETDDNHPGGIDGRLGCNRHCIHRESADGGEGTVLSLLAGSRLLAHPHHTEGGPISESERLTDIFSRVCPSRARRWPTKPRKSVRDWWKGLSGP